LGRTLAELVSLRSDNIGMGVRSPPPAVWAGETGAKVRPNPQIRGANWTQAGMGGYPTYLANQLAKNVY